MQFKIKDLFILILIVGILTSCSNNSNDKPESGKSNLIGIWKSEPEHFVMGKLFGNFRFPLKDSMKVENTWLSTDLILYFINDSTYIFKNTFGKPISGNYEYKTDSLKLKIKECYFYTFKIDSLKENKMYLSRKAYSWAFFVIKDQIHIHTGSDIKIILKKQDSQSIR
jgi:hypothetical protein